MLKRMQARGWITRTPSADDARVQSVHLAGTGSSILAGSTQHARAADAAILDALPRTKRRTFLAILSKLADSADAAADQAARDARKQAKREAKERAKARTRAKLKGDKAASAHARPQAALARRGFKRWRDRSRRTTSSVSGPAIHAEHAPVGADHERLRHAGDAQLQARSAPPDPAPPR